MVDPDRNAYDTGASSTVQGNLSGIASTLLGIIETRTADVKQFMADYEDDANREVYLKAEAEWDAESRKVKTIISVLLATMQSNDEHATTAQKAAGTAISDLV